MLYSKNFDGDAADRFEREFEQRFYEGDYVAMASVYTDDAKLMIEDADLIEGRPAIESFWRTACARGNAAGMKRRLHWDEFGHAGNLGFRRHTVTLEVPGADGSVAKHVIKSVTVWRCGDDGVWRIAIDISNRNAPRELSQATYGVSLDGPQP